MTVEDGGLWASIVQRSDSALASGALQPIRTRSDVVERDGIRFLVRTVASIEAKRSASERQKRTGVNPFLPYEEALFVADVSETHVCLLNKFPVVMHHILLVTRVFEDQELALTVADFDAMWRCLAELDMLVFYNAGPSAGASQPHKHLQLVPTPLGAGSDRAPIESLWQRARPGGRLVRFGEFPFIHAAVTLPDVSSKPKQVAARATREKYLELLDAVGKQEDPRSYNLLVTRDWMFLVPRSTKSAQGIFVNGLGYAGALLVGNAEELALLRRTGPIEILRQVGLPE